MLGLANGMLVAYVGYPFYRHGEHVKYCPERNLGDPKRVADHRNFKVVSVYCPSDLFQKNFRHSVIIALIIAIGVHILAIRL